MNVFRGFNYFLSLCVGLPIWFYLLHFLLAAAHADRLVWFLYWAYVPITLTISILSRAFDDAALDDRFDRWRERRRGL